MVDRLITIKNNNIELYNYLVVVLTKLQQKYH